VAPGNLPVALTGTLIGLIGVVCLISLLAYLKEAAEESSPAISLVPQIVWAIGLVGAASFGVGWGLVSAQPLAHAEAGVNLGVAPMLTYMISEATSAIIFGSAPMLVGFRPDHADGWLRQGAPTMVAVADSRRRCGGTQLTCFLHFLSLSGLEHCDRGLAFDKRAGCKFYQQKLSGARWPRTIYLRVVAE
jgi:hypothetical protein